MIALLVVSGALAQGWQPSHLVPLAAEPGTWWEVTSWRGRPVRVEAGAETAEIRNSSDEVLHEVPLSVHSVASDDFDRDGLDDLLLCGPDGLVMLRATDTRRETMSERPCEAVVTWLHSSGWLALTALGPSWMSTWEPGRHGLEERPIELDDSRPSLLQSHDDGWVHGHLGGEGFAIHNAQTVEQVASPGGLVAMAWGGSGWAWLEGEPGALHDVAGVRMPAAGFRDARSVDLDRDGVRDWVLIPEHESSVRVVVAGETSDYRLPVRPEWVSVGDLDGDGCVDLVFTDRSGQSAGMHGRCVEGLSAGGTVTDVQGSAPAVGSMESNRAAGTVLVVPDQEPGQDELSLSTGDTVLRLRVGQRVELTLTEPTGRGRTFSARGKPPGMTVDETGKMVFEAASSTIGSWSMVVRFKDGASWRSLGLVVVVDPASSVPEPAPPQEAY